MKTLQQELMREKSTEDAFIAKQFFFAVYLQAHKLKIAN